MKYVSNTRTRNANIEIDKNDIPTLATFNRKERATFAKLVNRGYTHSAAIAKILKTRRN